MTTENKILSGEDIANIEYEMAHDTIVDVYSISDWEISDETSIKNEKT